MSLAMMQNPQFVVRPIRGDDENSLWVSCNGCDRWLDYKSTGLVDGKKMPKEFLCVDCK